MTNGREDKDQTDSSLCGEWGEAARDRQKGKPTEDPMNLLLNMSMEGIEAVDLVKRPELYRGDLNRHRLDTALTPPLQHCNLAANA
jgi:hypothetical protein